MVVCVVVCFLFVCLFGLSFDVFDLLVFVFGGWFVRMFCCSVGCSCDLFLFAIDCLFVGLRVCLRCFVKVHLCW